MHRPRAAGAYTGAPRPEQVLAAVRCGDTPGYARVFTDVVSAKRYERPGLAELIDHARSGDRRGVAARGAE